MTVDILCPVFDGERYLGDFVHSVRAQTHRDWRLWFRDDGSRDASAAMLAAFAREDDRIRVQPRTGDNARLGVPGAFSSLLAQVAAEAPYVMFADQDDVWLPNKIEVSLAAMHRAETSPALPLLVHTDLAVVDAALHEIDPSFWHFARINPARSGLQDLIVKNVVTGATLLINRALRERMDGIPRGAVMHDWWAACVAAAFGQIIPVPAATVLYRQHGDNAIGARRPASSLPLLDVPAKVPGALRRAAILRADIAAAATQARVFLGQYGPTLSAADRAFLNEYSRIPQRGFIRRKLGIMRMQLDRENGFVQNAGILVRG